MGIFATVVFAGSSKFLAKWLVKRYLPDEPWAEAVATELGGETAKRSLSKIAALFDARLSGVARSAHPEFDRPDVNRAAVDREVELALSRGLARSLLAERALEEKEVLAAVMAARAPVGLGEAETELYKRVLAESVRIACDAAPGSPKFRAEVDRRLLDRSKETAEGVKALQALVLSMAEGLRGSRSDIAEIKESLAEISGEAARAEFEHRYCASVIDELDEVRLFGIDDRVRPEAKKQKLTTAYLSLNLTDENGSSAPMSMEQLVKKLEPAKRPFLLIRGDAGSGKSTLLKKLAIDSAASRVAGEPARSFPDVYVSEKTDDGELAQLVRPWHLRPRLKVGLGTRHAGVSDPIGAVDPARRKAATKGPVFISYSHPGHTDLTDWVASLFNPMERFPFFIPLRRCRDRRLPPLPELTALAGNALPEASKEWIEQILEEGRALFLIDGLDEVAPDHRKDIDAGLESWFKRFGPKGNLFVVTSRPLVRDPSWVADFKFMEARVAPMSRPAREQFVDAWHKAAAEALESSDAEGARADAAACPQKAAALKDKLAKRPGVARVASNPLMCAMVCALSTDVNYDVDRSPREIIETLCRVLVHEREKATPHLDDHAFPACYRMLTPDQRLEILGNLAFEMITTEMSVAGFDVLERHAKAMLGGIAGAKVTDAAELAGTLIERSGLLVKSKPARGAKPAAAPKSSKPAATRPDVDWIHATFKEFLAAEHFTASHEGFLRKNWERPDVRNVCVHLAAQRGTKEVIDSLLTRILDREPSKPKRGTQSQATSKPGKRTKAEQERQRQREYLALRIDEAAGGKISPEMRRRLDKLRTKLLPPTSLADAEALARLGDEILPDLRWSEKIKDKPRVQQACVRALRLIEHEDAKEALREYAAKAAEIDVIGELAEAGVNPLMVPLILKRLTMEVPQGIYRYDNDWVPIQLRRRIEDVAPLAELTQLQTLDLSYTGVTDVTPLAGLTQLQTLSLDGTDVTDVTPLAGLTQLQTLSLGGTDVTDVTPLAGLTQLQTLSLDGTDVTDVTPLAGLTQLQTLDLDSTGVTDVTPLAGLTQLQTLYLSSTGVTDVTPLAGLTQLQTLYLSSTGVTDVTPLAGLTQLQTLYLNSTRVTDVTPLAGLTQLQTLSLSSTGVTDVTPLAGLTQLRTLYLSHTGVTDVTPLARLKGLVNLVLPTKQASARKAET